MGNMVRAFLTLCGGALNEDGSCASFMQVTSTFIMPKNASVEGQCVSEFGEGYQACNAVQALGLAHVYSVPDHAHYWLKPTPVAFLYITAHRRRDAIVDVLRKCRHGTER